MLSYRKIRKDEFAPGLTIWATMPGSTSENIPQPTKGLVRGLFRKAENQALFCRVSWDNTPLVDLMVTSVFRDCSIECDAVDSLIDEVSTHG